MTESLQIYRDLFLALNESCVDYSFAVENDVYSAFVGWDVLQMSNIASSLTELLLLNAFSPYFSYQLIMCSIN